MQKTKSLIRKEIKELLLTKEDLLLEKESEKLCLRFLQSELYKKSDAILCYMPVKKEASTLLIIDSSIKDKKILALPKVVPNTSDMDFYIVQNNVPLQNQLEESQWKIPEPSSSCKNFLEQKVFPKNITLVVPGLAFSKDGSRLGRGKGFYDIYIKRLLEKAGKERSFVTLAGFCFDFQLLDFIPLEEHDVKMDVLFF